MSCERRLRYFPLYSSTWLIFEVFDFSFFKCKLWTFAYDEWMRLKLWILFETFRTLNWFANVGETGRMSSSTRLSVFCLLRQCTHLNSLFVWCHCTFAQAPIPFLCISNPLYSYYADDVLTHCGKVFAHSHTHDTHRHSISSESSLCPAGFAQCIYICISHAACLDWLFHVQSCYWISGLRAYPQPCHLIHCGYYGLAKWYVAALTLANVYHQLFFRMWTWTIDPF